MLDVSFRSVREIKKKKLSLAKKKKKELAMIMFFFSIDFVITPLSRSLKTNFDVLCEFFFFSKKEPLYTKEYAVDCVLRCDAERGGSGSVQDSKYLFKIKTFQFLSAVQQCSSDKIYRAHVLAAFYPEHFLSGFSTRPKQLTLHTRQLLACPRPQGN